MKCANETVTIELKNGMRDIPSPNKRSIIANRDAR